MKMSHGVLWRVVVNGVVDLPDGDRLSTHLLVNVAQTSASCACDVLIKVSASSSRCWSQKASEKKEFSQRPFVFIFHTLS